MSNFSNLPLKKEGPYYFPETSFHRIVVLPKRSCGRMSIRRIVILPNSKTPETILCRMPFY